VISILFDQVDICYLFV